MSVAEVKQYFAAKGLTHQIMEFEDSTATVELAAQALGVVPGRIAKTMSFKLKNNEIILVLAAGDKRVDNKKFKSVFHSKGKMPDPEEVVEITGHPVGGVCPFGLKNDLPVFLDVSLNEYDTVFPAAGSPNSAVKLTPKELESITGGQWVDVCS